MNAGSRSEEPARRQEGREHQRRGEDELTEALPRILGVGEAGRHFHQRRPAEEVAELDDDEHGEEEVDEPERDARLDGFDRRAPDPVGHPVADAGSGEDAGEVARREPRQGARHHDVGGPLLHGRAHPVGDEPREDPVRRHEESAEHEQEGHAQEHAPKGTSVEPTDDRNQGPTPKIAAPSSGTVELRPSTGTRAAAPTTRAPSAEPPGST